MNTYQQKRLIEAHENCDLLTEWEYDFIDSLMDREDDYELSDKQNQVLNRISQRIARARR